MKRLLVFAVLLLVGLGLTVPIAPVYAQSLTTGDITGVVTDPTNALIPGATVNLKSLDTGTTQTISTNQAGQFRFSLLKPGRYTVSAASAGFAKSERELDVSVGQTVTANFSLELGQAAQSVEVGAVAVLLNPDASTNTPFTQAEVEMLPSAGGDITNILWTAPGAVANSTGGYGNFTVNGMPATSNLFTVNGENNMDPYFNINNSGASNLTLGQNELMEATVISNAYGGEFGQLAGAQVTYITKSGTNAFHGNALYWWNGRTMNANDWFNNASGVDRPFSNANQWAASIGGPIRKDKTFFFADNEGLRFVLPNVYTNVTIPTPAFETAVLANVQQKQPNEYSMYQKMMGLWMNAPGASGARPMANSSACNSLVLPGFTPSTMNCAARFDSSANALGSEWMQTVRVDHRMGSKDNAFFRWKLDHGLQPTSLNPINPAFNALSNQPEYDNQFSETHVFGPRATNSFLASFSHYVAQFQQDHALASSTFPYSVNDSGTVPFQSFNPMQSFPQGRNITQYQFLDDYTLLRGKHNLKFGMNYRRYDVSDHNFFFNSPAVYFGYVNAGLQEFVNGLAYQYRMSKNLASDVPIAMWGIGLYASDDWRVKQNLKVTLTLRAEHNSNPVCQFNCFANLTGNFSSLASVTASSPGSVPYSSDINSGLHQAYQGMQAIVWSPRIGISYSPGKDNKTVISGGFSIAYDSPPAGLVDDLLANPPVSVTIRVRPSTGTLPFDPAGGAATWQASANAFNIQSSYSQIAAALSKLGAVFAAPAVTSIPGTLKTPEWSMWNFQIQRQLSNTVAINVNYVGNHGVKIPYANNWANAYDPYGIFPGVAGVASSPKVPNYGQVGQVLSGGVSSYNGLNLTVRKQFSHGVMAHVNYTWAHGLDEISNGGIFTYGDSVLGQINPVSLRANNYGNSDYDIRHQLSADVVYSPTFALGNPVVKQIVNGWQLGGKLTWRSGLPFSVVDGNWNGAITNGGSTIFAQYAGKGSGQSACGEAAVNVPCLNAAAFVDSSADAWNGYVVWPTQNRNQFRGPRFFDFDMNLFRSFSIQERAKIAVGIQTFNLFNHPNFGNPDNGLGSSTFGQILGMTGTPTSPYGTFLGFDSSPRAIQLSAKITF